MAIDELDTRYAVIKAEQPVIFLVGIRIEGKMPACHSAVDQRVLIQLFAEIYTVINGLETVFAGVSGAVDPCS